MPTWDQDYTQQLGDMLSPYQSAIQKLQRPYPMLGGMGDRLAVNHPLLASGLNQGLMSVAMTPEPQGPEGAGGGVSRALQGVLGASQYQRQQAIMQAMLPYQMLQPKLQALDTIAQIGERQSEVPYRRAMEQRAMAQSDYYTKRAGALDQAKAVTGDKRVDDDGNVWHGIMDPDKGYRYQNPVTQKYADELPADQQPSFENEKKILSASRLNEDYTPSGIQRRLAQGDPKAQADWDRYVAGIQGIAGGHAAGAASVTSPIEKTKTFVADEQKNLFTDLPKQPEPDFYKWYAENAARNFKNTDEAYKAFTKEHNDYFAEKSNRSTDFALWQRSGAPEQGIPFRSWRQQQQSNSRLPQGDTRPSTPSNSCPNWKPK